MQNSVLPEPAHHDLHTGSFAVAETALIRSCMKSAIGVRLQS